MTHKIIYGDCRELIKKIEPNSVGLIITDPPYKKKFNWCFPWLYEVSSRVLVDGGSLVFLLGHSQIGPALNAEYFELRQWWIGWLNHNRSNRVFGKNVIVKGKPWLWFLKGKRQKTAKVPLDTLSFAPEDWRETKGFHKWGQPQLFAEHFIEYLHPKNGVILDPFAGGGAFLKAAKARGIESIGFELQKPKVS